MVPFPSNPSYKNIVEIAGGHCSPYYLKEKDGWGIDLNELERSYQEASKNGKNVKALIIVNPGHPSGTVYDQPTLQQLIQFAHKHKLFIIADEVPLYLNSVQQRLHLQPKQTLHPTSQTSQPNGPRIPNLMLSHVPLFNLKHPSRQNRRQGWLYPLPQCEP